MIADGLKRKLRVLLVQLPVPNNPTLNTPLAAGYLKAYAAAQGLLDQIEIDMLPRAIADHAGDALVVEHIVAWQPDVLGVSLYTWNSERSLEVARRVKQRLPTLYVAVGGPEVQHDNHWVLNHPAVDVAVLGEGEQTFADLLRSFVATYDTTQEEPTITSDRLSLDMIPGIAFRRNSTLHRTAERVALTDLSVIPSPYLSGYLDVPSDGMLMVEVSRWCPYACSFCLYGRNMGSKLGKRYFDLDRVVSEIAWGKQQGVRKVHFVEANLNLVPLFWPLMTALAEVNADRQMTFYAELRGEHLTDDVVRALNRANVRYVEVGLQTANPAALQASHRRTNLLKWAAGTRRLYAHEIEVYLDVIVGLPADDAAGVAQTLDFIDREGLGPYDIFTLQVLPGTAVRHQAEQYQISFQDRPPYYVLGTDRLRYTDLRRLRRDLKRNVNLPPDAIEGMPMPRRTALIEVRDACADEQVVTHVGLSTPGDLIVAAERTHHLGHHVDVVAQAQDMPLLTPVFANWLQANPSTVFDVYLHTSVEVPEVEVLEQWGDLLPYRPGYLDRVAVYLNQEPDAGHHRVSPRIFLVLPWSATVVSEAYDGVAGIIWRFDLSEGDAVPLGAWRAAGGAGIWLHLGPECSASYLQYVRSEACAWEQETGRMVWLSDSIDIR